MASACLSAFLERLSTAPPLPATAQPCLPLSPRNSSCSSYFRPASPWLKCYTGLSAAFRMKAKWFNTWTRVGYCSRALGPWAVSSQAKPFPPVTRFSTPVSVATFSNS